MSILGTSAVSNFGLPKIGEPIPVTRLSSHRTTLECVGAKEGVGISDGYGYMP